MKMRWGDVIETKAEKFAQLSPDKMRRITDNIVQEIEDAIGNYEEGDYDHCSYLLSRISSTAKDLSKMVSKEGRKKKQEDKANYVPY